MENDLTISEGYNLWLLLGLTYSAILKARKRELEPLGISQTQSWALWGLKYIGHPATVAEMSRIMVRDHQTTSQLLKRMEKEGLVERHRSLQKRGPIKLIMTAKGEETLQKALERREVIDDVVYSLSQTERANLRSYLERLHEKAVSKTVLLPHLL